MTDQRVESATQTVDAPPQSRKPSLPLAWTLAARPKTLPAAASPVIVALALARADFLARPQAYDHGFLVAPALCCLAFALLAQIAANFINDYADFKKGADDQTRKGPARAVASGWISPRAMLVGTILTLGLACLCGLGTLYYGGPILFWVGLVSCVFCVLYSYGPVPLSYVGLGDVLVVAFFGVVAVVFTYYAQTREATVDAVLLGLAIGLACDNILVANNYRDRDEDRSNRKWTLVALFGERFGRYFYLFNGVAATTLLAAFFTRRGEWSGVAVGALVVYLFAHLATWRTLARIRVGSGLVRVLALSARNLLLLAVLVACALCF